MKRAIKPKIQYLAVGAGTLGLALRRVLYATGVDEKGLLVRGHWAQIALIALSAVVAAGLLLLQRRSRETEPDASPASFAAAAGCILAAGAVLWGTVTGAPGMPPVLIRLVGYAAAAALLAVGWCRLRRARPPFLFHAAVCIYFALQMVLQYRVWSSDPQIFDYCFYLGAYIALVLTAYQHAALDAGMGSRRALRTAALASVYLCLVSLLDSMQTAPMLCFGIWAYTNLSCCTAPDPEDGDAARKGA